MNGVHLQTESSEALTIMSEPHVTVMIPVRNEERHVGSAVESILRQSYHRVEVLVIDDRSEDNTVKVCRSFADPRLHVYTKTSEPRGPAVSRNIAIEMASGEYLANQDADDWSEPTRIEKQLTAALQAPGRRIVGCHVKEILGARTHIRQLPERNADIVSGFNRIMNRATFVAGAMLAPRAILRDIRYRPVFKYQHDWDLLLRLAESGRVEFYNHPETLYNYVIRPKGTKMQPDWVKYNLFVRASQQRRKCGRRDFATVEEYLGEYGRPVRHPWWFLLGHLISVKCRLAHHTQLRDAARELQTQPRVW
ncbi:MAG: glycosyltransferase family 2 protein [Acidobacteriia bacterium]|nr:glycosyltransferase family 2 protein [Terriglobia bacterium]